MELVGGGFYGETQVIGAVSMFVGFLGPHNVDMIFGPFFMNE